MPPADDDNNEDNAPPPTLSRCRPVSNALLAKSAVFTWVAPRIVSRPRHGGLPACAADNYISEYNLTFGPRKPRTQADKLGREESRESTKDSSGPETKPPYVKKPVSMNPVSQTSAVSASPQERLRTPLRPSSGTWWNGPRVGGYNGPREEKRALSELNEKPSAHRNARHKLLLNTDYQKHFCELKISDADENSGDRGGSVKGLVHGWETALAAQERRCTAKPKKDRSLPVIRQSPFACSATDAGQFSETRDRRPASMGQRPRSPKRPSSALRAPPEVRETRAKGFMIVGGTSEFQSSFTSFPKQPKVESLTDKLYEGWQLALAKSHA